MHNFLWEEVDENFKNDIRKHCVVLPDVLMNEANKVFISGHGKDIEEFVRETTKYLEKTFNNMYEENFNKYKIESEKNFTTKITNEIDNFSKIMETIINIFSNSATIDKNALTVEFFKSYLEESVDLSSIFDELKQLHPNITLIKSNRTLQSKGRLFSNISFQTYEVCHPNIFFKVVKSQFETYANTKDNIDTPLSYGIHSKLKDEISDIRNSLKKDAIGCTELCPYCGAKCTQRIKAHTDHTTSKHRLMSFKGCFELNKNKKKDFVFDLCNSDSTLQKTYWKDSLYDSKIENKENLAIREKMEYYGVSMGNVTFTLSWKNWNDLDLHVTCPDGTDIYHGNKKCEQCNGFLDLDMNVCCCPNGCPKKKCSNESIENCFFNTPKMGIYKVHVKGYNEEPKNNSSYSTPFEVRVETHDKKNVKIYMDTVDCGETKILQEFEHTQTLSFTKHVEKFYPSWKNINPEEDKSWEGVLKKAWVKVAKNLANFYGYEDNTPPEWKNL